MSNMHVYEWFSFEEQSYCLLIQRVKLLFFLSLWYVDDEGVLIRSALQGLQDRQNWGPQQVRLHVSIFSVPSFSVLL